VREAGRDEAPDLGDLFGRARTPEEIVPLPRLARGLVAALRRGERSRAETLAGALADLRTGLGVRAELRAGAFRSPRPVRGSDHPGATWPPPPVALAARHDPAVEEAAA
jgi:hypothetical protein